MTWCRQLRRDRAQGQDQVRGGLVPVQTTERRHTGFTGIKDDRDTVEDLRTERKQKEQHSGED